MTIFLSFLILCNNTFRYCGLFIFHCSMTTQWSVLPLPYLNRLLAGCAVFTLSTYVDQVYEDNR